jgi:cytosine permease
VIGSVLAAAGILDKFVDFLVLLGVAFPPIAGIMTAEYFVVKRWRAELESTRETGAPPATAPTWVPATLIIWIAAALIGKYWEWGLPSVNSLVIAFVGYVVAGRLGLVRGVGLTREKDTEEALVDETEEVRRPSRERP